MINTPIVIRVFLTVVILLLFANMIDWQDLYVELSDVKWPLLGMALLLQVTVLLTSVFRWWLFFYYEGYSYPFTKLIRPFFIGAVLNHVLPASIGGDSYRIFFTYKEQIPTQLCLPPIVVEKIIGLTIMLFISVLVIPFNKIDDLFLNNLKLLLPVLFVGLLLFIFIISWSLFYRWSYKLLKQWDSYKFISIVLKIFGSTYCLLRNKKLILYVSMISGIKIILESGVFLFIIWGLNLEIKIIDLFLMAPLVLIVSSIPISLGGLGIREVSIVTLFILIGMTKTSTIALAILFLSIHILSTLPGLYYLVFTSPKKTIRTNVA
jgi:glycosyltransferase 2 family protein